MLVYRLFFLIVFMASIVTWVLLWLVGFLPLQMIRGHVARSGGIAATGLTLVLIFTVLELLRIVEGRVPLFALLGVGLVIPWGTLLIVRFNAFVRDRKLQSRN
ncbi:MAG: hypothetical protein LBJ37_16270 [Paucimonas sp.]|jgi:hypothetical protein|nr:hypothetical protein [Paucimonas sp.]